MMGNYAKNKEKNKDKENVPIEPRIGGSSAMKNTELNLDERQESIDKIKGIGSSSAMKSSEPGEQQSTGIGGSSAMKAESAPTATSQSTGIGGSSAMKAESNPTAASQSTGIGGSSAMKAGGEVQTENRAIHDQDRTLAEGGDPWNGSVKRPFAGYDDRIAQFQEEGFIGLPGFEPDRDDARNVAEAIRQESFIPSEPTHNDLKAAENVAKEVMSRINNDALDKMDDQEKERLYAAMFKVGGLAGKYNGGKRNAPDGDRVMDAMGKYLVDNGANALFGGKRLRNEADLNAVPPHERDAWKAASLNEQEQKAVDLLIAAATQAFIHPEIAAAAPEHIVDLGGEQAEIEGVPLGKPRTQDKAFGRELADKIIAAREQHRDEIKDREKQEDERIQQVRAEQAKKAAEQEEQKRYADAAAERNQKAAEQIKQERAENEKKRAAQEAETKTRREAEAKDAAAKAAQVQEVKDKKLAERQAELEPFDKETLDINDKYENKMKEIRGYRSIIHSRAHTLPPEIYEAVKGMNSEQKTDYLDKMEMKANSLRRSESNKVDKARQLVLDKHAAEDKAEERKEAQERFKARVEGEKVLVANKNRGVDDYRARVQDAMERGFATTTQKYTNNNADRHTADDPHYVTEAKLEFPHRGAIQAKIAKEVPADTDIAPQIKETARNVINEVAQRMGEAGQHIAGNKEQLAHRAAQLTRYLEDKAQAFSDFETIEALAEDLQKAAQTGNAWQHLKPQERDAYRVMAQTTVMMAQKPRVDDVSKTLDAAANRLKKHKEQHFDKNSHPGAAYAYLGEQQANMMERGSYPEGKRVDLPEDIGAKVTFPFQEE